MENTNTTNTTPEIVITELPEKVYEVETPQPQRLHVSGEDKRKLLPIIADWEARYKEYAENGKLEEYFAQLGRYQAMYKGIIPVETLPKVKIVKLNEKQIEVDEPFICADFFSTHPNTRLVKNTLGKAFSLLHNPNAQSHPQTGRPNYLEGHFGARRFKVWNVTRSAATKVFEEYKDQLQLYFLDTYFYNDRIQNGPIAETTLPKSNAQLEEIDALLS